MAHMANKLSVDFNLVITDRDANKICELLSDYLNEHWNKELKTELHQKEDEIFRVVTIEDKE